MLPSGDLYRMLETKKTHKLKKFLLLYFHGTLRNYNILNEIINGFWPSSIRCFSFRFNSNYSDREKIKAKKFFL